LFEVVGTLHARGGLAHFLDCGEEQSDEDCDDRDDNEKLDQRETAKTRSCDGHTEPREKCCGRLGERRGGGIELDPIRARRTRRKATTRYTANTVPAVSR